MSDTTQSRLSSVDVLRGLVMIVMALDHVRDYFHNVTLSGVSPTDFRVTNTALFLTRWITHFCAPTFALTAGIGAFLWYNRGRTRTELTRFLATRGLWLMFLEVTVLHVVYLFSVANSDPIVLLVFWSLGLSMVVLSALIWLPQRALGPLALAVLLAQPYIAKLGVAPFFTAVFAGPWGDRFVLSPYPLIPWVAVMLLGFAMGPLFSGEAERRRRWLLTAGIVTTVAFVVLRFFTTWADPVPREFGSAFGHPVLGFINASKYPPSPLFLMMTLGPAMLTLVFFEKLPAAGNRLVEAVKVIGRVPLFYYIMHFFVLHALSRIMALVRYGSDATGFLFKPYPNWGTPRELFPENFGYDLWVVYVMWAVVIAIVYPLCRWYAGVKARRRDWWLSYL